MPLLHVLERTDVFIKPDEDLGENIDPAQRSDQGSNHNNNLGTVAFFQMTATSEDADLP